MQERQRPITVDIWSDFICPWCWIAKRRFEKALSKFVGSESVAIRYRAFRISNNNTAMPFVTELEDKFSSPNSALAMMNQVKRVGEDEGLTYHFEKALFGNTELAHRLVACAQKYGFADAIVEQLYSASFNEGRSIFDPDELTAIAIQAGMDPEIARHGVSTNTYKKSILADEFEAIRFGARSVPLFVLNQKYVLQGLSSEQEILAALEQVETELYSKLRVNDGPVCDLTGCGF